MCSYCRLQDETTNNIFVECKFTIKLWSDLRPYCQCRFDLSILNPQSATFGFFQIDPDLVIFQIRYYYYTCANLFIKRLFKAFTWSPIEKYSKVLIWKKIRK